jgi:hypothetical protein
MAAVGLLTSPFWLLGQTELIHGVVPGVPAIEVIPLAVMGWEAWLAALAVTMGIQGWRDGAGQPAQGPAMPA